MYIRMYRSVLTQRRFSAEALDPAFMALRKTFCKAFRKVIRKAFRKGGHAKPFGSASRRSALRSCEKGFRNALRHHKFVSFGLLIQPRIYNT